ncbi:rhodanese-like domain-containing protein [Massilia sp. H6]|uniref:MBL fold metallo-hydrolase n=1 Tax=Massilia sp. H6 TaxID=2970464 RepID=UPI002169248D|nr:MBL fold metallo-hydrolase [Massilia sp. H6]UVW30070.1 MBL fold metallo-hydrolase [Massilia sp. H6]
MFFERVKTAGLGHNAYILGCGEGLAVVVDPRRDVAEYLQIARENNLSIAYCIETHRQEDFEYGSASLAEITGAKILAGKHPLFGRADVRLGDGEEIKIGSTRLVALATPGHTPESMCYAVYPQDAGENCWGVFTGDTIFVGDTGRTDLSDREQTAENAGLLYDGVHQKLAPLGDQALILPAHGAGSACGGNISERDDSTIGIERGTNPVFKKSREAFMQQKASENLPRPPYFSHMEVVNLEAGRPLPAPVGDRVLSPSEFKNRMKEGMVIDTRSPEAFAGSHIHGSYNVWLKGLSAFGGWIADDKSSIFLIVDEPDQAPVAIASLARIGIDGVQGVLVKGVEAWREAGFPIEAFGTTSAEEASQWMKNRDILVLDVRDDMEWEEKHIPGAQHVFVGDLEANLQKLPKDRTIVAHCSVGHRSAVAMSILRRNGFTDIYNMLGGITAWEKLGLPLNKGAAN